MELGGRVAFVTGGGSGMGRATGTCRVVLYGRRPFPFEFRHIEGHEQFKPAG